MKSEFIKLRGMWYQLVQMGSKESYRLLGSCKRALYDEPKNIYDCYVRPSMEKINVYNSWLMICYRDLKGYSYTIASYNCQLITLAFENDDYYFYITPSHNYAFKK